MLLNNNVPLNNDELMCAILDAKCHPSLAVSFARAGKGQQIIFTFLHKYIFDNKNMSNFIVKLFIGKPLLC